MAVDLLDLPLGVTAWREIINYNFALINAQANGIPIYATKPTSKKEDLIFVTGTGFMEWNTTISPNAYTKNLILTTADLQDFADGNSNIKLSANAIKDVDARTEPLMPIFDLTGDITSGAPLLYTASVDMVIKNNALYYFLRDGEILLNFTTQNEKVTASSSQRTAYIYLNNTAIWSGSTSGNYSMYVTITKGDILKVGYSDTTSGWVPRFTQFMPYANTLSIAEGKIALAPNGLFLWRITMTSSGGGGS
jgi:hypothetical protein